MRLLVVFFLAFILFSCKSNNRENSIPDELKAIPNGIEVSHNKEVVYAELNKQDPESRGKYKWHYETTVKAIHEDLTITEFGAYIWHKGEWQHRTIYDRAFNNEEFEKWYSAPGGKIIKGKEYTDPNNWNKGDVLDGKTTKSLWYFIGENDAGKTFKGTAEISSIHEMEKSRIGQ
jgi:hypothetical protein